MKLYVCWGTLALMFSCASSAAASSVSVASSQLRITGGPGEQNFIGLTQAADGVHVRDGGSALTPGPGCRRTADEIVCESRGLAKVIARLGDQNDALTAASTFGLRIVAFGGDGRDSLGGGGARDELHGGPGIDSLSASWRGGDLLDGGAGDDRLSLNALLTARGRGSRVLCGPGLDQVSSASAHDHVGPSCERIYLYQAVLFRPLAPTALPSSRNTILVLRGYYCERNDCRLRMRIEGTGSRGFRRGELIARGGSRGKTHGFRRVGVHVRRSALERLRGETALRVRVVVIEEVAGKISRDSFYWTVG